MTEAGKVEGDRLALTSQVERKGELEQLVSQTAPERYDMSARSGFVHFYRHFVKTP
jgi:hypothetical protein